MLNYQRVNPRFWTKHIAETAGRRKNKAACDVALVVVERLLESLKQQQVPTDQSMVHHGPPGRHRDILGYLGWGPGMMIRMTIRIMIYHDSYINCYYYVYSDEDDADRDHEFEC